MDAVFLKLLNTSITAAWLIVVVIVLRLILKKAPKWLSCTLWALVAFRLVCPFSFESTFSLIPSAQMIPQDFITGNTFQVESGISLIDKSVNGYLGDHYYEGITASATQGSALMTGFGILWLVVTLLLLTHCIISYLRLRTQVREAICLRDNIWLCDAVHSPFILGVIRPQIYLPSSICIEQMNYVLAHEQAHLKRKDHWWKPLGYLLLSVYWFNPFIWIAYILLCRDIELACDENVIKDMDLEAKKAYSYSLVACSIQRKMILACPLAFGEIGVKERVKAVLNYKKPAFWIIAAAIITCIIVGACFLTNPQKDTFDIKIRVPAGGESTFYFSDEEISPKRSNIKVSSGNGLGDTEVVLKSIEASEENAYDQPIYLTPGLPVRLNAEKGAWFQIGVNIGNPTDEELVVFVHVEGVDVRISDSAVNEKLNYDIIPMVMINGKYYYDTGQESARTNRNTDMDGVITSSVDGSKVPQENDQSNFGSGYDYQYIDEHTIEIFMNEKWIIFEYRSGDGSLSKHNDLQNSPNPATALISLDDAITSAILAHNASAQTLDAGSAFCDFVLLDAVSEGSTTDTASQTTTYYGWALYQEYEFSEQGIEEIAGSHVPVALTLDSDENGYHLKEYWEPRDGSYFVSDIREKFPANIVNDGINSQKFIAQQKTNCYRHAIQTKRITTDAIIADLLNTICSDPVTSSNPQDYIDAHVVEYRELGYYGEYTLRYCFERFIQGNETGSEGKIMAMICEELLQTKDTLPEDARTAETGQLWFDTLYAHGSNLVEPYL